MFQSCLTTTLSGVSFVASFSLLASPTSAEIVPDASLPEPSRVTVDDNRFTIEGGTPAGTNLFHSFWEFSIPTGGEARFNNSADIENILTRVTGQQMSQLDGLLATQGNANLIFLNPNGIVFGENARLDIGGTFLASTGRSLSFADGSQWSTIADETPTLTVSVPVGLQLGDAPGTLVNRSLAADATGEPAGLTGVDLALVGGDVRFEGGQMRSPQRIQIASLGAGSRLTWDSTFGLQPPADLGGEVSFLAGATAVAPEIRSSSQNLTLSLGSQLLSPGNGRLDFNAGQQIEIREGSGIFSQNGSPITLETSQLFVLDGGQIASTTELPSGGDIRLDAQQITLAGNNQQAFSTILSQTTGSGDGGAIAIESDRFTLNGTAVLASLSTGTGRGGDVSVRATEGIQMSGLGFEAFNQFLGLLSSGLAQPGDFSSGVFAVTGDGGGGHVRLETSGDVQIREGAIVLLPVFGSGTGGDLTLEVGGSLDLVESGLLNATGLGSAGSSGQTTIQAERVLLRRGGAIAGLTLGNGNSGNIRILARDSFEAIDSVSNAVVPTGVFSNSLFGTGEAGDITIRTARFINQGGGLVVSNTGGVLTSGIVDRGGLGGDVTIEASELVRVVGVSSDGTVTSGPGTTTFGAFPAGNLTIIADRVEVGDGAIVSSGTVGTGNGGTLVVRANEMEVFGQSSVNGLPTVVVASSGRADFNVDATGNGGDLRIQVGELTVRDGAALDVRSFGTGNAGLLEITADRVTLEDRGSLNAATASGLGGNILLRSRHLFLYNHSTIATNAGQSDGGNITLDTQTLVALGNSDITANALEGRGGRVVVTAESIFGTQFRDRETPQSDITATSALGAEFSGVVEINTPDAESASGLVDLEVDTVDPSSEIVRGCAAEQNTFAITGRGGLAENPTEELRGGLEWSDMRDWRSLANVETASVSLPNAMALPLREATTWVVNANGEAALRVEGSHRPELGTEGCAGLDLAR